MLHTCREILQQAGANISLKDTRNKLKEIDVRFKGVLTANQEDAVTAIMNFDYGVLVAPTGSGKTIMACQITGRRKTPTLILVHRKQLIDHWKQQISAFLEFADDNPGIIAEGKEKPTGIIDIGMLQTLARKKNIIEIVSRYEQIIIDECHHIPAFSFESVINKFPARYVLGLTATPCRKDGHQPIIYMQCGPVRYELKQDNANLHKTAVIIETSITLPAEYGQQPPIHEIWDYLTRDEGRLKLITDNIITALQNKRFPLVISDRKEHLNLIQKTMHSNPIGESYRGFVLTGDLTHKARVKIMDDLRHLAAAGEQAYILATGSYIGEGFNLPVLDTLFLTMPVAFKGRLVQYAGRINRESTDKKEIIIYDYVDASIGLTIAMFKKRIRVYKKMGYTIAVCGNPKILKWVKKTGRGSLQ